MKRYLRIYLAFARYCLMRELEFRVNFIFWCFANALWAFLSLFMVQIVYSQVDSIAGWGKNDAYVLTLISGIIISLLWAFVLPTLTRFHRLIRDGDMDFYLLKPVQTRFLVSTRVIEFDMYPRLIVLIYMLISFVGAHYSTSLIQWILFSLSLVAGILIFYNFGFMATTLNFWFINIFNLENFFDAVYDLGRLPVGIFKGLTQLIFIFVIPMAFLGTFPAMILLGKGSIDMLLIYLIVLIMSSLISQWFWNFAIKRYASASS